MVMMDIVVIIDVSECCIINSMSVGPERLSSVRLDIPLCFSLTDWAGLALIEVIHGFYSAGC